MSFENSAGALSRRDIVKIARRFTTPGQVSNGPRPAGTAVWLTGHTSAPSQRYLKFRPRIIQLGGATTKTKGHSPQGGSISPRHDSATYDSAASSDGPLNLLAESWVAESWNKQSFQEMESATHQAPLYSHRSLRYSRTHAGSR